MPVARVVQLATHLEQKRLAEIAYETRRFVRIGESDVVINQRIADKSQPIVKIYHYHCNHLGTPQELTNDRGDVVWLNYSLAWGGSFDSLNHVDNLDGLNVSADELQPIRFQGQFFDGETNLHYNRFRYYDSDVGMFISRDPIGLLGGDNVFAYAPNPNEWIDPLGLATTQEVRALQKADRNRRFFSSSAPYPKHTKAKTLADAQRLSVNHAQYWNPNWGKCDCKTQAQVNSFRNSIEKEGLANGILVDSGKREAVDYYVYDAKRTIGYNLGKPTQYMRIEVNNMNLFHGHPISLETYNTLLKKEIKLK